LVLCEKEDKELVKKTLRIPRWFKKIYIWFVIEAC